MSDTPSSTAATSELSADAARVGSRYARTRTMPGGAKALLATLAVIIVALVVWLGWAIWVHSTPQVGSTMTSWTVVNENQVDVTVTVKYFDKTAKHVTCTVAANAADHSTVGYASFKPLAGTQQITIRTDRDASSVDWNGCTTDSQNTPN